MSEELCLGLMSGTSMDGIDAALIKTDGEAFIESIASAFYPYPADFQKNMKMAERCVKKTEGDLIQAEKIFNEECAEITFKKLIALSTHLHAEAAKNLLHTQQISPKEIQWVGYHGQTLYHAPAKKITIQVGRGDSLAKALGIPVVSQFRINDIQHGGQGAPLVPIYHWALVKNDHLIPAAVLNCGGIANVTLILSAAPENLLACDTGPGNVLLDRFVREKTQHQCTMDQDGHFALAGKIDASVFVTLMGKSLPPGFLNAPPPKSLDSYDCQLPHAMNTLSLEDGCATLAAFSAECMARSVTFCQNKPFRWILAGGGWHHPVMLSEFKNRLEKYYDQPPQIVIAKQLGWQQDTLEAEAFAYLAKRASLDLPLSFPGTTGVSAPLSGGEIFYPQ